MKPTTRAKQSGIPFNRVNRLMTRSRDKNEWSVNIASASLKHNFARWLRLTRAGWIMAILIFSVRYRHGYHLSIEVKAFKSLRSSQQWVRRLILINWWSRLTLKDLKPTNILIAGSETVCWLHFTHRIGRAQLLISFMNRQPVQPVVYGVCPRYSWPLVIGQIVFDWGLSMYTHLMSPKFRLALDFVFELRKNCFHVQSGKRSAMEIDSGWSKRPQRDTADSTSPLRWHRKFQRDREWKFNSAQEDGLMDVLTSFITVNRAHLSLEILLWRRTIAKE